MGTQPSLFAKAFTDHPSSVDETYSEHMRVSLSYARRLAAASAKAVVHSLVPGLCCTSASAAIRQMNDEIVATGRGSEPSGTGAAA